MVTTDTIAGWTIVRMLGYVEGRHATPGYAINELLKAAHSVGANAIVAVRWSEIVERPRTERLVYGTAVAARPTTGEERS
jgi:uncharacterized protein YbjQ (UPF0145 family)